MRSLDVQAADRFSAHRPDCSILGTQHRLKRSDATLILRSSSILTGAISNHPGIDCHQSQDTPQISFTTLPAAVTEIINPEKVLSMLSTLERYCGAQRLPRPDIMSQQLASDRENMSSLASARERAYTAKALAETGLTKAVARLNKVERIANETNVRLGARVGLSCGSHD